MIAIKLTSRFIAEYVMVVAVVLVAVLSPGYMVAQSATNTFPDNGNAGIGITTPAYPLDINTTNATVLNVKSSASGTSDWGIRFDSSKAWIGFKGFAVNGGGVNDFGIAAGSNGNLLFGTNAGNEVMRLTTGGNVGIGTTSPQRTLQITASNAVGILDSNSQYELYIGQSSSYTRIGPTYRSGGAFVPLTFWTSDTERVRIDTAGNLGIGTTSPSVKLEVVDSSEAKIRIRGTGSSDAELSLGTASNGRGIYLDESDANKLKIYTGAGKGAAGEVTIDNNGNVGIGVNPTVALDVHGDIQASGVINAKYQDVAEWVPSSEQLATGTVVVLDSTKSNQVTSSSVSYDTRVAGVVSEQPGIALGEKSENKVLVATTGRVRVKVDASKGAIHIGDLLVTSDVPGLAMKSEPMMIGGRQLHAPGTLIGKALEPLEKGRGTILVLLSLQ